MDQNFQKIHARKASPVLETESLDKQNQVEVAAEWQEE